MTTSALIQAIQAGVYDADIQTLKGEILNRSMLLQHDAVAPSVPMTQIPYTPPRESTIYDFKVGQTVKFNNHVNTRYLIGATATVVEKKRTRLVVRMDTGIGRFPANCRVKVTPSIITAV